MSAKISDLQERQIVNIADGKCLGNIKDIELNVREGVIQALVLPGISGFRGILQNQGELLIPWQKVVRIGVDVVLINMPELTDDNLRSHQRQRRRRKEEPAWQQEVEEYQREYGCARNREAYREVNAELQQGNIIVLPPEEPDGY